MAGKSGAGHSSTAPGQRVGDFGDSAGRGGAHEERWAADQAPGRGHARVCMLQEGAPQAIGSSRRRKISLSPSSWPRPGPARPVSGGGARLVCRGAAPNKHASTQARPGGACWRAGPWQAQCGRATGGGGGGGMRRVGTRAQVVGRCDAGLGGLAVSVARLGASDISTPPAAR